MSHCFPQKTFSLRHPQLSFCPDSALGWRRGLLCPVVPSPWLDSTTIQDNNIQHRWVEILSEVYLALLRRLYFFCKCSNFFSRSSLSNLALRLSSMALSLSFRSLCSSFRAISLPSCAFLISSLASWFSLITLCSSSFSRSLSCLRWFKACRHQDGIHSSFDC